VSSEEAYALYYDLLYSHRDVAREVDFLERVFSQCSQVSVRRVLDMGCGTGIHSIELARRGYEVLGVDLSQKMIEVAREKSRAAGVTGVYFLQADATRLEFEEEFDAAIAMYGVISYFTRDENLLEFLRSLRRALKKGGVFVFDTWNLTGVLSKRVFYETPSTSIRKSGSMLAIKEEVWRVDVLDQVAHAEIKWSIVDLVRGSVDFFDHRLDLRIFTVRELVHVLRETGFALCAAYEDYEMRPLTEGSSELVIVARAV
jgi:SAM-dependent methyltransferase